jgi:hypothetical protein
MATAQTDRLFAERAATVVRFAAGLPTYGPDSQTGVPTPTLTGIAPATGVAASADTLFTATGTNFINGGTTIMWGVVDLPTTYVDATHVTALAPLSQSLAGPVQVKVRNGTKQSSAVTYTVT